MNKYIRLASAALLSLAAAGCADYLDVVPDKTQDVSLLYSRKETAYRALATCYHYMPVYECTYGMLGASDELIMDLDRVTPGKQVVLGSLTPDYPVLGYWNDDVGGWDALGAGGSSMYKPLRICNDFLQNIVNVPDMTQTEITRWSSEVKFLKAYYHYLLFSQYGAIPLIRQNANIDATGEELMPKREPVDVVVDYIVSLIDEATPGLPARVTNTSELGRIDQVIAKSFKAKVLLLAASPLFNNNPMYAAFADKGGQLLFPSGDAAAEKEKWVKAAEAFKEAIAAAEAAGIKLYEYTDNVPDFDASNYVDDPRVKYMYNYQYAMVEKWNSELVWGASRIYTDWHEIQRSVNFKSRDESSTGDAWQWMSVTMNAVDFFYTENGLPMEEDPDFNYEGRTDLVTIPDSYAAVAVPGEQTVAMHLGREPRFYASIGFDRSRVRGYGTLYDMQLRFQERNGRQSEGDTDNSISGYFLRKVVHPDTKGDGTITRYAWPIMRLADLYLSYAEALNEAYGTEKQAEILEYLNRIRARSGVPSVEEAWAKAKLNPNKYTSQEGMREIIHRERAIELAFEGQRNEDVRRWLEGSAFNSKIRIWNMYGSSAEAFYTETELTNMRHVFSQRNYLWPIPTNEMVNNTNLVQNPGY
ncbi:MAG: RagB/SusD family nutrient uptake outer membrane protein [Bacteroidales bacterium]|nr:RagB/SusD family nutrient uptake outer membrane protein [Bacteroidales bacterium]